MGIIVDIIFLLIVILSAFLGYKKGLVNLAAKLFAGILAIIITVIVFKPITNWIIDNTQFDEKIQNIIIEKTVQPINEKEGTPNVNEMISDISRDIIIEQAKNISEKIVTAIVVIVIFVTIKIVLSIIFAFIDAIASLPILKQFNEVGGIIYGIIRGTIIVLIVIAIMGIVARINPNSNISSIIENTQFTKVVYNKVLPFTNYIQK